MNNKRICIIKRKFSSQGGLEKYTFRIAQALLSQGASVDVVTADNSPKAILSPHFRVHKIPADALFSFQSINRFDQLASAFIRSTPYNAILGMDRNRYQTHIRAGNGVHAAFLQRRAANEPWYISARHMINPLHRLILSIEKSSFEDPNLSTIFTNSNMVKQEILQYYSTDEKKITVVHNGVEWKEFTGPFECWLEAKTHLAQKLELDPMVFHFLFIGHGFERKGLRILLHALANIKGYEFHLSIVGKDKKEDEFKKLAHRLGLYDKVTFFGAQSHITPFYQLCDALVIPSLYDPFANVTVEALAMGLFVVSSLTNGASEILTPSSGTIIENLFSQASVEKALVEALKHPKTWLKSQTIRESVKHLDFSSQLHGITDPLLS